MASIKLFGRGRSAAAPVGGAKVSAAQIADAFTGLSTAAVSTTWRCRHGAGASIGEGAVDFEARRSRATVIRGKSTYEYVRQGASVFRAAVPEESLDADADADTADVDLDGDGDEAADVDKDAQGAAGEDLRWETFSEHDACGVHAYAEPTVLAAGVRAAGAVQVRDMAEYDGKLLAAYSVTVKPKPSDPDRLLARLARHLRDHGANTIVVTAFADESEWDDGGDELIVLGDADEDVVELDSGGRVNGAGAGGSGGAGAQGGEGGPRIVRLRIELPHWTPADDPTADHAVSVELFELGDPVEIEVPDGEGAARRSSRSCADLALF